MVIDEDHIQEAEESSLQETFDVIDRGLKELEKATFDLEKESRESLHKAEKVDQQIERLIRLSEQNDLIGIQKRLIKIRTLFNVIRGEYLYPVDEWRTFDTQLDMLSEQLAAMMLEKGCLHADDDSGSMKNMAESASTRKTRLKARQAFFMAENGGFHLLIGYTKLITKTYMDLKGRSSVRVDTSRRVRLKRLPGDREAGFGKKWLLVTENKGRVRAFAPEKILGELILTTGLLRENLHFLHRDDGKPMPYFRLKGERYYIV